MNNKIKNTIAKGYKLEIGTVIENSFEVFKKTALIGGLGMLVLCIATFAVYFGILGLFFGFSNFTETMTNFSLQSKEVSVLIFTAIFSILSSVFIAPFTAGNIHLNYLAKTNQEIEFGTIFKFYSNKTTKDLFLSYAIIGLTNAVVNIILVHLNLEILSYFLQSAITAVTVFTIPLIVYGNQNFSEAITNSIKLFMKQPFAIIVLLIVGFIIAMLGLIALCIGILFTLPYVYSMYFSIYDQTIGFEEKSEIDEIGISEE